MRLLAISLLALVLSACGGQGGSGATATDTPVGGDTTTTGGGNAPTNAPSLAQIVKSGASASYKVSYRVTTTGGGQTMSGQQTWYLKGERSRFDFATEGNTLSMFDLADGAYLCTSGAGSGTTCLGLPKDQALAANQAAAFDLQIRDKPESFNGTYEGTRSIAGQTAECFGVRNTLGVSGEWRICYTSNGIPLLIQTRDQGLDYTMEATSFSASVPDADFALPATPTRLGY